MTEMRESTRFCARIAWLVSLGVLITCLQAKASGPIRCEGQEVRVIDQTNDVVRIDGGGEACIRAEGLCQVSIQALLIQLINCEQCVRAAGTAHVALTAEDGITCQAAEDGLRAEGTSAIALATGGDITINSTQDHAIRAEGDASVALQAAGTCALHGGEGDIRIDGNARVEVDCQQGSPSDDGEEVAPVLTQDPLIRGQAATFRVSNAHPGELVFFFLSTKGIGLGPCLAQLGGLCLDLLRPALPLGSTLADSSGKATLIRTIPPWFPAIDVHTQAAIQRGIGGADSVKTNTITASVQP
jgi:hypothetical protein